MQSRRQSQLVFRGIPIFVKNSDAVKKLKGADIILVEKADRTTHQNSARIPTGNSGGKIRWLQLLSSLLGTRYVLEYLGNKQGIWKLIESMYSIQYRAVVRGLGPREGSWATPPEFGGYEKRTTKKDRGNLLLSAPRIWKHNEGSAICSRNVTCW